jgi:hypothetical protein
MYHNQYSSGTQIKKNFLCQVPGATVPAAAAKNGYAWF